MQKRKTSFGFLPLTQNNNGCTRHHLMAAFHSIIATLKAWCPGVPAVYTWPGREEWQQCGWCHRTEHLRKRREQSTLSCRTHSCTLQKLQQPSVSQEPEHVDSDGVDHDDTHLSHGLLGLSLHRVGKQCSELGNIHPPSETLLSTLEQWFTWTDIFTDCIWWPSQC